MTDGTPYVRNPWRVTATGAEIRTGHCRRCGNGLGHDVIRNGRTQWRRAGKPSGTTLQGDRRDYTDEMPRGAKVVRRREIRRGDSVQVAQLRRSAYYD
jgi:hypothetical protein